MPKKENITTEEKPLATQFPGSLRDWFAGQALAGILSIEEPFTFNYNPSFEEFCARRGNVIKRAYMFADAMLKEREKELTEKSKPAQIFVDGRRLDEGETIAEALEKIE